MDARRRCVEQHHDGGVPVQRLAQVDREAEAVRGSAFLAAPPVIGRCDQPVVRLRHEARASITSSRLGTAAVGVIAPKR